jgi:hypothetical protein
LILKSEILLFVFERKLSKRKVYWRDQIHFSMNVLLPLYWGLQYGHFNILGMPCMYIV